MIDDEDRQILAEAFSDTAPTRVLPLLVGEIDAHRVEHDSCQANGFASVCRLSGSGMHCRIVPRAALTFRRFLGHDLSLATPGAAR